VHRQVPWLGDLPILKHLFSYDLFDMQRTELLIIMTPHVVRSQGDMERLKQAEFARISWCEADVFAIHGDVYPSTDMTTELMDRGDWNVVYPAIDPRGLPEATVNEAPPLTDPALRDRSPNYEVIPPPSNVPSANLPLVPSSSLNGTPTTGSGTSYGSGTSMNMQASYMSAVNPAYTTTTASGLEPQRLTSGSPSATIQDATFQNATYQAATFQETGFPTVPTPYDDSNGGVVPAVALQSLVPPAPAQQLPGQRLPVGGGR
jgi:hypothetical protein